MSCPYCDGDNIETLEETYLEDQHIEQYQCLVCGCVWTWNSTRVVDSVPEEEMSHVDQLKKIQEEKDLRIRLAEEEEDEDD